MQISPVILSLVTRPAGLVCSRSPRSQNVAGVVQMDRVRSYSCKTTENIIKLNVSLNRQNIKKVVSSLVIEFHAGGTTFEIAAFDLWSRMTLKHIFFWKHSSKSGCALYTQNLHSLFLSENL